MTEKARRWEASAQLSEASPWRMLAVGMVALLTVSSMFVVGLLHDPTGEPTPSRTTLEIDHFEDMAAGN